LLGEYVSSPALAEFSTRCIGRGSNSLSMEETRGSGVRVIIGEIPIFGRSCFRADSRTCHDPYIGLMKWNFSSSEGTVQVWDRMCDFEIECVRF
jgi:hypothetical protein